MKKRLTVITMVIGIIATCLSGCGCQDDPMKPGEAGMINHMIQAQGNINKSRGKIKMQATSIFLGERQNNI